VGLEVSPLRREALVSCGGVRVDREPEAQAAAAQAGTEGTAFAVQDDEVAPDMLGLAPPSGQGRQGSVVERRYLPCVQQQVDVTAADRLEETGAQLGKLCGPDGAAAVSTCSVWLSLRWSCMALPSFWVGRASRFPPGPA
jgi:hypothetical protein